MTARVWIVRHGNTFDKGETVRRVGARTDLALSSSGEAQAQALAARFAGAPLVSARTGPLTRTVMTARAILAAQADPPELEIDPLLREIDYGPDEGRAEADVVARLGEAALALWESEAVVPPDWKVEPEALIAGWRALFGALEEQPGDHLVVTSNGVARFALFAIGAKGQALKLPTGGYGRVDLTPGEAPICASWGVRGP